MRTCAGGVLVRDGELLLARRAEDRPFYPGMWDVIGGNCEPGEAPADALRHGCIATKPVAARWARATLAPRWTPLIARALALAPDAAPDLDETLALIRHAGDEWRRARAEGSA